MPMRQLCLLPGEKRTCSRTIEMSANDPKRTSSHFDQAYDSVAAHWPRVAAGSFKAHGLNDCA